ncbi:hypothetical protein CUJ83_06815 [Methanocella sp. CWC-04]|uniref:Radical SAM core domain-containing protein n=1 Tax=Methanooceanicella nereidis TaxID=2052831 RepID=A0AAP2RDP5_9EURY|nr:radical SAM protein [Methanocella sp. CWC-04]MCD1294710.1 hypothetical protein [Methanocella sp. CWC-04]
MFKKLIEGISAIAKEPETGFIFEVTARCNNNCLYCYNIWKCGRMKAPQDISSLEWSAIADKLCDESLVRLITISGGEPFLRKDLPEITHHIASKRIKINLITNGTLLSEENVSKTIEDATLYEIPLLSDKPEVHDHLSGAKAFERVLDGMANVKAAGGDFTAVFVATAINSKDLLGSCEMAIALGAKSILYNRFNPGGEGLKHIEELQISKEILQSHLDTLESISENYGIGVHCAVPVPPCIIDTSQYKRLSFGWCPTGKSGAYYTIDPSGKMRPCNHSLSVLGDFRDQRFKDLKSSTQMQAFKSLLNEECKTCVHLSKCNGGCRAVSEQLNAAGKPKSLVPGIYDL